MLPFVLPALYGAKAISTGLAALGLGATVLPPAIDFAKSYAKRGRTKGESGMSQFGGTDFTALPGGSNFEPGMRPGDIDRRKIGEELNPSPLDSSKFDNNLEGQYQRYFKTPEFDNVFGAGARGEGAPKDAAAMEVLGNQLRAPAKDTNIASMYAAQSGMGRVNEDAIQAMYSDRPDMQAWAKANPMLAQREYLKAEQRRANEMPLGPDNETVMGDLGSRAQMDNPMGQEAYDLIKKRLLNRAAAK